MNYFQQDEATVAISLSDGSDVQILPGDCFATPSQIQQE